MRGMLKDVPKDLKKISPDRRKALCQSYSSIGKMASQLANCKNAELTAGLAVAKVLCAKTPVATKKPGSTGMRESERWRATMFCLLQLPALAHL